MAKLKKPKKPKISYSQVLREINQYIYSSSSELSSDIFNNKGILNQIVNFYYEQLWLHPKVNIILDRYLNRKEMNIMLFNTIEKLDFIKLVINQNNISSFNLFKYFPKRDTIKIIEGISRIKNIPFKEAKAFYINRSILNPKEILSILNKEIDENDKLILQELIKQEPVEETTVISETSDSSFLPELTQEVIEQYRLNLFDIQILKKTNQALFIFIDKDNKKRYYLEPFEARIYMNIQTGILNNDYFIDKDNPKMEIIEYLITDEKLLQKLKRSVTTQFEKEILDV